MTSSRLCVCVPSSRLASTPHVVGATSLQPSDPSSGSSSSASSSSPFLAFFSHCSPDLLSHLLSYHTLRDIQRVRITHRIVRSMSLRPTVWKHTKLWLGQAAARIPLASILAGQHIIMTCLVMSWDVMSCHIWAGPTRDITCHITPLHARVCRSFTCISLSYHIKSCDVMSCDIMCRCSWLLSCQHDS